MGMALSARRALGQMSMPMPTEGSGTGIRIATAVAMLHGMDLRPFADALPLPNRVRSGGSGGVRIGMREVFEKVHADVPPSRIWTYCDLNASHPTSLAPLIEMRSGRQVAVEWVNQLPMKHFLPVDFSLHGCGHDLPEVRACVHLHGGRTPTKDDGYPEDWFVPGQSRRCHYPLEQDGATLWYHDHAMGLNRLNIYAGLLGMAIVRDRFEDELGLPSGKYEVPLILTDRSFTAEGQLFYPSSGDPDHPWVPEFSGDCMLINGKVRPYFEVEPRLYRLRVLNGSNSRFFALALSGGQPFYQIGSDQGLLSAPVLRRSIYLAPAERADLLVDFSDLSGQHVQLLDGVVGILEFRVAPSASRGSVPTAIPRTLRTVTRTDESSAVRTRTITLNEYVDKVGNSMVMLLNQKHWHEPVTETPRLGTTEIWEFVNLTEDTHPMHLHLVRFQILDRRVFDVFLYRNNKGIRYLAGAVAPEANEAGWKDTVQCPPGMITRIIVRFDGYAGRYLYHCHILEHEANDMMRPFEVIA
jgi:spore coat protein A